MSISTSSARIHTQMTGKSEAVSPSHVAEFDNAASLELAQCLIDIGVALSSERDLDTLLNRIVKEARALTHAEGGSLYLRKGDRIRFAVCQNDYLGTEATSPSPLDAVEFSLDHSSIAGHVILSGQPLNLDDAYCLPADAPYKFNKDFDRQANYKTHSVLTVPLRRGINEVVGALQLINYHPCDYSHPLPFPDFTVRLAESLASQATVAYSNVCLTEELKSAHYDTIFRLSLAAEFRDSETSNHLKRMSHYSRIIAKYLGLSESEQELIFYASPMHDIGKIGISDSILLKPGRFTSEERKVMEAHTIIGAEILANSDSHLLKKSEVIALSHHEKFDGSGYPRGLKGDDIPLEGRIVALADVFDALSSKRVYKEAWSLDKVYNLVERSNGTHFDPDVVTALYAGQEEILDIYHQYQDSES
ncbi:MAG: HD domain-containing phosphohydrolase [Synechococcus sp.]